MLVLSRKRGETILVGDGVVITVQKVKGNHVSLSIKAPKETRILRGEVKDKEEKK